MKLFHHTIIDWYEDNGRKDLPWRTYSSPYRVLIAEILLRQTRVSQVAQIYPKIIERYPNVYSLSLADKRELKSTISQLGLTSRAEYMVKGATLIVRKHGGTVPQKLTELKNLPGVGKYIAHSVICFGFRKSVPLVDSNVSCIYSRIFWGKEPQNFPLSKDKMWKFAVYMLPRKDVQRYNSSLLDLGGLVCNHRKPNCSQCPLSRWCRYN